MTAVGWPGVRRATEWGKKKYAGSLAEDLWRRLDAMDVINRGMLFAATLLLCFFPFLIVVSALAGRSVVHTLARSTGLNSEAAADAGHLFASPAATSSAVVGTASMVFFVFGGIAAATALQEIYELAFDLPHRGMKDIPRRLAWLAVLIGASLLGGWAGPGLLHVGGPALLAAVGLAWATGFWWLTMRILLAGRISWRPLFPAACATGVLYVAMEVFFSLFFSAMVISDDTRYGPIGIIFALLSYLIAIGVVVILGAVAGLVWQERSSGKDQAGHLPLPSGESRGSDDRQHQRGATRLKSNRMPRILGVARRSPRAGLCRRFRFRAQNREFGLGLRPGDQASHRAQIASVVERMALGYGEGWRTAHTHLVSGLCVADRGLPGRRPRLAAHIDAPRCSNGCSRDTVDRQSDPRRGETPRRPEQGTRWTR
jgi:membrane protein